MYNSKIWSIKDPIEVEQYDYADQRLFMREAAALLDKAYVVFDRYQMKFHIDDRSGAKAVWMLQVDALDMLRDCIRLAGQKRHRIIGRMFRDIIETIDLSRLLLAKPEKYLPQWYKDEIVAHREYREILKSTDPDAFEARRLLHQQLSEWTHHTYYTLKNSYSLGRGGMLVYDSHSEILILPQTISQYLWMLGVLTRDFLSAMSESHLFTAEEMSSLTSEE